MKEQVEMDWELGEGVVCVASKGLVGGGFWKCGNDWSYGRFRGSVASKGVSGVLEELRGLGASDEKDRGAGGHGIISRAEGLCPE